MVNFNLERQAIEERLAANYSAVPIKYENLSFVPPTNTSWIALTILTGSAFQASLGTGNSSRLTRFSGIIQIDIYTPEGVGTKSAKDIADVISAIYDNVQFSSGSSGTITCRVPDYKTLGIVDGWYHAVVSVAYQRSVFS